MEFKDFLIVLPDYHASKHDDRREINERAVRLMAKFGISDVAENDITEVSGGQLQRACITRIMLGNNLY